MERLWLYGRGRGSWRTPKMCGCERIGRRFGRGISSRSGAGAGMPVYEIVLREPGFPRKVWAVADALCLRGVVIGTARARL
jgi:hypothetical protein